MPEACRGEGLTLRELELSHHEMFWYVYKSLDVYGADCGGFAWNDSNLNERVGVCQADLNTARSLGVRVAVVLKALANRSKRLIVFSDFKDLVFLEENLLFGPLLNVLRYLGHPLDFEFAHRCGGSFVHNELELCL